MKNYRLQIISFIGILLLITAACSFSASTAKIKDAYTARDNNGVPQKTSTFAQDEIFYCMVVLANAPEDTVVKAVWYAVDVEGSEPNFILSEKEFTGGGEMTFNLSNDKLWPIGSYKVELYLNGENQKTLDFAVQ
ncbi:MAG: hypothetical protein Q8N39_09525 [Pelolinea sp.]|nr:hypothetical protein [Pelolinea sp.]